MLIKFFFIHKKGVIKFGSLLKYKKKYEWLCAVCLSVSDMNVNKMKKINKFTMFPSSSVK